MTIRAKSFLIFMLLVAGLLVVVWQTSTSILLEDYVALEQAKGEQNLERLRRSVGQELSQMDRTANDWGSWNETYEFVADLNPEYIAQNITPTTYDSLGITLNLAQYLDLEGRVVFDRGFDFHRHQWVAAADLSDHHTEEGLLRPLALDEALSGIVMVDEGPMLTIVRSILTSAAEGPSRGRIVMGRLLDDNVVQHLGRTTRLDVVAHEWNAVDLPPDVESAQDELSSKTPTSVQFPRDDLAHGYLLIDDIYGEPAVILKATMDREIYLSGKSTIEFHIVLLLAGGLVCVLICMLFLDRTVLVRLTRLVSQVNQIREDRSIRMEAPGNDEISVLARQLNVMLTAVEQAEANLRESNQSLERRVEERTEELAGLNRQLESEMVERKAAQREAEEQAEVAEKANYAKSAFLANISHEVRTPMNAILGYSDILQRALTDPQQRGYLSSIDSSGRTLISLLESILDFSRLQSGDLVLDTSAMQVRSLITDLDRSFESEAEAKGLSYSSSIAENIPDVVLMDESRVRQVLLNLVGNAIKFTGSGTVTLQVTASEDASGATIVFSIRDTGIGIAPDQQERIFGAFDQQAGQSINEYGGTGMGLALSRGLATLMNGEITVASELGAGSEFTVTIPGVEVITRPTAPQEIETDQGQVSIDVELSDDTIAGLPDLLERLQSQTATLDSLTETLTINDLESFARSMSSMGREFDYPPLENWANILAEQVRGFDMDAIPHTLQAYLDVQEAIKARVGR